MNLNVGVPLVDDTVIVTAAYEDLSATIEALTAEQVRRALADNDPGALADKYFDMNFSVRTVHPVLENGLLICPGVKTLNSKTSHDCAFIAVDSSWVWDHSDAVWSEIRKTMHGSKMVQQSVTIVPVYDGVVVDVVTSKARSGPCKMSQVKSYVVKNNMLEPTSTRTSIPRGHS